MDRKLEIPTNAMKTSKYNTKECKYDHMRPMITSCDCGVEIQHMRSARLDGACCDEAKDSSEYE